MRYSVHPPRAFRNRIAKSIGVLVAAALVAALGMPSLAQAQTITKVAYTDGPGFAVTWTGDRFANVTGWIVTFTNPAGTKVTKAVSGATAPTDPVSLNENDLGTWWIQVGACTADLEAGEGGEAEDMTCPAGKLESGEAVGYTHGIPAAPANFDANAVTGGVALTWRDMTSDHAIMEYEYAFETKADGKPDWKVIKTAGAEVIDADPGEHTFMLRAVGSSDNDTATTGDIPGVAASKMVTVPMSTPTLPEIAMLLLAMLLLGSGAYLLRGRQSGGLTHA